MIASSSLNLPLEKCPALVLNADYRPLSYYPLSLWSWQDAVRDVFLERVNIVSEYDRVIRSPSFSMRLPSVISLKAFSHTTLITVLLHYFHLMIIVV